MCTPRRVRDGSRGAVSNLRSRDHAFEDISTEQPYKWAVKLLPLDLCRRCEQEEDARNHEGIRRVSTIPLDYPECVPKLDVEIVFGLADENRTKFLDMAIEESNNNEGMPAICTICEVPREWLAANNVKGLDDASMHVQMMRRSKEDEQKKVRSFAVGMFLASDNCFSAVAWRSLCMEAP